MSEKLGIFCVLEQKEKYQILKETMKKGESPEECLARTVGSENSAPFSWKARGILILVREEKPTEYMFLFSARQTLPEDRKEETDTACWSKCDEILQNLAGEEEKICFRLMMEKRAFFSLKVTFDRRNILRSASVNGKPLELFDILKEDGSLAGIVRERGVVHLDGSLHPTSHIWIVRRNHSSGGDLLLQKRSLSKDSNPGCYDISSAGHVSAGDTYLPAALRELGEELGIRAEEKDLHLAGMRKAYFEDVFYGKPFRDYEISAVYVYDKSVDEKKLVLQESEVEDVKWMDFQECCRRVDHGGMKHCIYMDELEIVGRYLIKNSCTFPAEAGSED